MTLAKKLHLRVSNLMREKRNRIDRIMNDCRAERERALLRARGLLSRAIELDALAIKKSRNETSGDETDYKMNVLLGIDIPYTARSDLFYSISERKKEPHYEINAARSSLRYIESSTRDLFYLDNELLEPVESAHRLTEFLSSMPVRAQIRAAAVYTGLLPTAYALWKTAFENGQATLMGVAGCAALGLGCGAIELLLKFWGERRQLKACERELRGLGKDWEPKVSKQLRESCGLTTISKCIEDLERIIAGLEAADGSG